MNSKIAMAIGLLMLVTGCVATKPINQANPTEQVTASEIAFAKTMADRDHVAFMRFIADDAVFLNGGKPLRGKAAIGEYWKRFYAGPLAPFSWKPDLVEVSAVGVLAQSVGPVTSADGKIIARFYSTWRLEPDGNWRVVFDDGYDVCEICAAK